MGLIEEAYEVSAATVLGNCRTVVYEARGLRIAAELLMAGQEKFGDDFWVRDALMQPSALISVGKAHVLRNCLEAMLHLQQRHEDPKLHGLVFRKLSGKGNARRNIDLMLPFLRRKNFFFTPEFATAHGPLLGPKSHPIDSYPLAIIAISTYVKETKDVEFALDYMTEIERLLEHLEAHSCDGLIKQSPHGCWRDHWHYEGKPLLIQLLYQHACERMAELKEMCSSVGPEYLAEAMRYKAKARRVKQQLDRYWNGEYFITAIEPERKQFSTLENSLAILYGIADEEQQQSILNHFRMLYAKYDFLPIQYPSFSFSDMRLIRLPFNYQYQHGRICLPWNQCIAVQAIATVDPAFANRLLAQMAKSIVRYGNVEVLKDGHRPYLRIGTFDERKFTWGALAFLQAANTIRQPMLVDTF